MTELRLISQNVVNVVENAQITTCPSNTNHLAIPVDWFNTRVCCSISPSDVYIPFDCNGISGGIDITFQNLSKETDPMIVDFLKGHNPNKDLFGSMEHGPSTIQKTRCILAAVYCAVYFTRHLIDLFGKEVYGYAVWYRELGRRHESTQSRFERTITYIACCTILKTDALPHFSGGKMNLVEFSFPK